jgi:hypothetical protein
MGAVRGHADLEGLRQRLRRARWRTRTSAIGGPEWDAATAEIEELEAQIFGPLVLAMDDPSSLPDGPSGPAPPALLRQLPKGG